MKIDYWHIAIALFITFIAGWNIGIKNYDNIWNSENDGLQKLNCDMKKDKSDRLGIVIITRNGIYSMCSLGSSEFKMAGALLNKTKSGWKMVMDNLPNEVLK